MTEVPFQLTEEWRIYEIDLAESANADVEILAVPFGRVFYRGPVSFSVRNVRYTMPDPTRIMNRAKT
ncbi:MAG: hypothetical protein OEQ16_06210 [Gammaproteobacteria bacterium]|jgi:hypothetical protein|nr:hypothetical protein [Gammaproteobacteria bacterium]MDH3819789.1 hypothetical protein [Gammaproteobacteria bacterium]MDH3982906.1 hypothetical protein [Gammaproteobacteria bacterium]